MNKPAPRYEAIIFDIDDTLLTAREPKWQQHTYVAKHYYGIDLDDNTLRAHWGKTFDELVAALYQNRGTAEERRTNFTRHELEFPKRYEPYAFECLTTLHNNGVALGLMTAMWSSRLIGLSLYKARTQPTSKSQMGVFFLAAYGN